MTLTRSLPTQHASGLPLIDERRTTLGLFARNSDGTARVGVLPAHSNPIVTGRASMGYDIAAFNAVTARTAAGAEQIANDGSVTVTTTPAPGANSRIDVIWVRAQFQILGDANNDVVFGVTQGTAAVSPTKPAIPAGALEFATATIPSTATTTLSSGVVITNTFQYTAAAGGVVRLRNSVEQAAWTPQEGTLAYRMDTEQLIVYVPDAAAPGWHHVAGKPVLDAITFTGIYSSSGPFPARVITAAGRVSLEGTVVSTGASFASGTAYNFGSIPPALAPTEDRAFAVTANGLFAILTITSTGAMTFTFPSAPGGVVGLSLSVSCPSWRLKGL